MMTLDRRLIIFSDLDGTLLNERTYSFEAANPALALVRSEQVPLVLCSSKTRAEIEPIQREMRLRHPFIVENGGAIYIPRESFAFPVEQAVPVGSWLRLEFGTPYRRLVEQLSLIKKELGGGIVGFSDLTPESVAADCGLSLEDARRAKAREYDEPFKLLDDHPETALAVQLIAERLGVRLTRGGRYFHLTGENDKGRAVKTLTILFQKHYGAVFTVGVGDSLNDWPLLANSNLPILVRRPDGEPDQEVMSRLAGIQVTDGIGPTGWNEAVLEVLSRHVRLSLRQEARDDRIGSAQPRA
jgi:mannosyl-3-phosphoglycerate phosphatase